MYLLRNKQSTRVGRGIQNTYCKGICRREKKS